jgi:hypothetical protein
MAIDLLFSDGGSGARMVQLPHCRRKAHNKKFWMPFFSCVEKNR